MADTQSLVGSTATAVTDRPLLEVEGLCVEFETAKGWLRVVEDASFSLEAGRTLGLVGETGSGKTVTSQAVMGLTPLLGGRIPAGSVKLGGHELMGIREREWQDIRGNRIAMIFQQAIRSLNPAFTVGEQIAESLRRHRGLDHKEAWRQAVAMLDRVHIANAATRAREYPHTFSGGMCQRAMIAMALVCEPEILIADEPTTALDVTVQAVILNLLRELQDQTNLAILFITHDLGVVAEMCDETAVMYSGQIVERSSIDQIFEAPHHPYTAGLLASIPRVGQGTRLDAIRGNVPPLDRLPPGCRFHPRCDYAVAGRCNVEPPALVSAANGSLSRCVRVGELALKGVDAL